jgi:competence ComEA-like helix-hairpin-helix protein
VEPEEAKRPQVPAAEPAELERLGGVNLNVATANELLTLDGMTPAIAQAIITHRTQHGSFSDVFSLHDVGRVGRKTFKSITGMNYNPRRTHRREKLAKLLKLPASSVSHLPTIVKAMVERTGFAGCILSDDDGFVLAQSGADEIAENFSATVPRTMQQVRENMSIANISGVDLVSIGVEDRMITVVASGNIFITYVQKSKRLTKGQVSLAERIGEELAWLLSHRGYVGQ